MPDLAPTAMPAPVDALQLLALLTRVRGYRVAAGDLSQKRLHDVRAFKSAYAELGYLRRLAGAGRHGGTVVTSMRQLVTGLAAIHPEWDMTGDPFAARDRHHQAVRRRLRDLEAMGLLRWRVGVDLDGEERRTEIELRSPPGVTVEELQAAAVTLGRWQARYGQALNTGSSTGIRNAAGHGRPLTATERQRRGCEHTRNASARRRVRGDQSNSAPPSGAFASLRNTSSPKAELETNASVRTRVTRTRENPGPDRSTAIEPATNDKTAGNESGVPEDIGELGSQNGSVSPAPDPDGLLWDEAALVARVMARQAERAPVIDAIARQARARTVEVAGWTLERGWPQSRLREAWVVARWGATVAAEGGASAAGPLSDELYVKLRRAVARYERNAAAAPDGYPTGGLAALLHLGTLAATGQLHDGPRLLAYAIGRLDQLSKRIRAHATADSVQRRETAAARAERRRAEPDGESGSGSDRAAWPPWIRCRRPHPTRVLPGRAVAAQRAPRRGRPDPRTWHRRLPAHDPRRPPPRRPAAARRSRRPPADGPPRHAATSTQPTGRNGRRSRTSSYANSRTSPASRSASYAAPPPPGAKPGSNSSGSRTPPGRARRQPRCAPNSPTCTRPGRAATEMLDPALVHYHYHYHSLSNSLYHSLSFFRSRPVA